MFIDGRKKLSKQEINEFPFLQYPGTIHIVQDYEQQIEVCQHLNKEEILGFDTETRPNFRKGQNNPVALLQLATKTDAYLFQLKQQALSPDLSNILSSAKILKLGVAVRDDIIALQKLRDFQAQGFIELADLAEEKGLQNFGLNALSVIFTGHRLKKSAKLSNWAAKTLKDKQIHYAACDAYVSLLIHEGLLKL
ncbi:3'-5' exonuclease domain-containing protein 2 [bacterium]|nr:3'-5' exonuclease domain-containing protein 2 [bacterium]